MGREVRRVPPNWQHPKTSDGHYRPLYSGRNYEAELREWDEEWTKWQQGLARSYDPADPWRPIPEECRDMTYSDYAGERPSPDDYMPTWPDDVATHYMMYECTSEGTPISPAFATPEELARWLADTGASAFAGQGAPYEHWLRVCRGGYAPSAVSVGGGPLVSGVVALTKTDGHPAGKET